MNSHNSPGNVTIAEILGELTWLITQSERHQAITIKDLSWLLMTPLLRKQFHIFRDGTKPVGLALWAFVDEAGAEAIRMRRFNSTNCLERAWCSGNDLWLVELIAPFSTSENHQAEIMLADLISGCFKGKEFKFLVTSSEHQLGHVVTLGADSSNQLSHDIVKALNL